MSFTGIDKFMADAYEVLGYDQLLIDGDAGMRRVAFDLAAGESGMSGVIGDTPVDTGRARSSWMISRNRPDTSVAPDTEGRKMPQGNHGARVLSQLSPDPQMGSIWLTNSLVYIRPLEFGHSKQAPRGMLRKNVARIRAKYRP